jgi:hypothetical protein
LTRGVVNHNIWLPARQVGRGPPIVMVGIRRACQVGNGRLSDRGVKPTGVRAWPRGRDMFYLA